MHIALRATVERFEYVFPTSRTATDHTQVSDVHLLSAMRLTFTASLASIAVYYYLRWLCDYWPVFKIRDLDLPIILTDQNDIATHADVYNG